MINKDLILRENLALERTKMAQYRTALAFARTALYFPVAGISMNQALDISYGPTMQWLGIFVGLLIFALGGVFYFRASKRINQQSQQIGNYTLMED